MTTLNNNYTLHHKHIARAYELERLQRYDLALQEVQRALDLDPHSAEAHACGAWVLRQSGRLDDAEDAARSALSFDPMLAAAHNVLACILWSKGNLLAAEEAFEAAIAFQQPDTSLYITNYARMKLARMRPQEALDLANRAVAIAPSQSYVHEVRGEALRMLGKTGEAIEALLTALRLDPRNARAHNSLGQARLAQGHAHEAQDSFREALRLQPGERKFQANLVSALRAQYPFYGRLLAFTMRTNTARGRVYFLWVSVIAFGLILFLPVALDLVYGFGPHLAQDEWDLWMLIASSAFAVWLLALTGSFLLRPFFNLLLRLDARNRAVVESDPADVIGVGLLLAGILSLLAYAILLVMTGPSDTGTLLALYLGVASLIALLLCGGMRGAVRMRRFDASTTSQRRVIWTGWVSYLVLVVSLFALAAGSALNMVSSMTWVVWLFVVSLCAYVAHGVARIWNANHVSTNARRALIYWLLGVLGIAFVGFLTAMSLGLEAYDALLAAIILGSVSSVVTTHKAVRGTRLYRQWVTTHGELSARNRIVLLFMGACACLGVVALAFRYLRVG